MQCVAPEFYDDQAQNPYSEKHLLKDMSFIFLELGKRWEGKILVIYTYVNRHVRVWATGFGQAEWLESCPS